MAPVSEIVYMTPDGWRQLSWDDLAQAILEVIEEEETDE